MQTNYFGTLYCTKEALAMMRRDGRLVFISSFLGKAGLPNMSTYAASKFAVTGFAESMHFELHRKGIWTHVVYPAAVKTPFFEQKSFSKYLGELHPGRFIHPRDVSKAVMRGIHKNVSEIYVPQYLSTYIRFRALFVSVARWIEKTFYMGKI